MTLRLVWISTLCSCFLFIVHVFLVPFVYASFSFPLSFLVSSFLFLFFFPFGRGLFQVWDDMIIESALKIFYGADLAVMIQAIQGNITNGWSADISSWENCASELTVCPNPELETCHLVILYSFIFLLLFSCFLSFFCQTFKASFSNICLQAKWL